jgi:hypothetical protein
MKKLSVSWSRGVFCGRSYFVFQRFAAMWNAGSESNITFKMRTEPNIHAVNLQIAISSALHIGTVSHWLLFLLRTYNLLSHSHIYQ